MSSETRGHDAVIYEVDLTIDSRVAAEFDEWLAAHVGEMLDLPGFESAEVERVDTDAGSDSSRRSVRYRLASRAALDAYLDTHAARMRADGVARFGDAMHASRRILEPAPVSTMLPVPAGESTGYGDCANCGEHLTGQYCYQCGQRDKHRLISLWELLRDLIGDLFELDSRLWRTLFPLMFRPGFLTREYLSGRRVHYTPPLRMYLVLSLAFFVVAGLAGDIQVNGDSTGGDVTVSLSADDALADDDAPGDDAGTGDTAVADPPAGLSEADREKLRRLGEVYGLGALGDVADAEDLEDLEELGAREDARVISDLGDRCADIESNLETDIEWLKSPAVIERMTIVCKRLTAEGGMTLFAGKLVDNIPAMMFVFLPLIALVMKFLYIGSRRYYVEHLLFFVHFHSFFFLALTVTVLVGMVPSTVPAIGIVHGLLIAAVSIYTPVYLFRSMRKVYGQWWIVTFAKYLMLFVAYFVSLLVTFTVGALFTALTV